MSLELPQPSPFYDPNNEAETRRMLEDADGETLKRNRDVQLQPGQRLVLTSPAGNLFAIVVSDAGVLSTASYP